eukprot:COSAG04_NODE_28656_length_274_cov_0.662857_1_plen_91_part_11
MVLVCHACAVQRMQVHVQCTDSCTCTASKKCGFASMREKQLSQLSSDSSTRFAFILSLRATDDFVQHCFFKQKTAYGIMSGDWSSDVCSSD